MLSSDGLLIFYDFSEANIWYQSEKVTCPKLTMNASFVEFFRCLKQIPEVHKFAVTLQPHSPVILCGHFFWYAFKPRIIGALNFAWSISLNPYGGPTPHYPSTEQCPSCSRVLPTVCMLDCHYGQQKKSWRDIKVVWILMWLFESVKNAICVIQKGKIWFGPLQLYRTEAKPGASEALSLR